MVVFYLDYFLHLYFVSSWEYCRNFVDWLHRTSQYIHRYFYNIFSELSFPVLHLEWSRRRRKENKFSFSKYFFFGISYKECYRNYYIFDFDFKWPAITFPLKINLIYYIETLITTIKLTLVQLSLGYLLSISLLT